jgi:hypothetical protein
LTRLRNRISSGKATAAWIDELMTDFDRLSDRAWRVRNVLVHGGPVADEAAASVLSFVESAATDALHMAIKGLLSDRDLIDHALDLREQHRRVIVRLKDGEPASDALFWEEQDL